MAQNEQLWVPIWEKKYFSWVNLNSPNGYWSKCLVSRCPSINQLWIGNLETSLAVVEFLPPYHQTVLPLKTKCRYYVLTNYKLPCSQVGPVLATRYVFIQSCWIWKHQPNLPAINRPRSGELLKFFLKSSLLDL